MVVIFAVHYGVSYAVGIFLAIMLVATNRPIPVYTESTQLQWLDNIISALLTLTYFACFEGFYGATPGKLITGMRVIKKELY